MYTCLMLTSFIKLNCVGLTFLDSFHELMDNADAPGYYEQ